MHGRMMFRCRPLGRGCGAASAASFGLTRSPPPPQQPDNGYGGQQNERVYKSIRTIHCRTSVLPALSDNLPETAPVPATASHRW